MRSSVGLATLHLPSAVAVYRSSQRSWQLSLNMIPVGEPWIRKYACIFLV